MHRSAVLVAILASGCATAALPSPRDAAELAFGLMVADRVCLLDRPRSPALGPAGVGLDGCIRYDGEAMAELEARYGPSVSVGIFAHELGHVIALGQGRAVGSELEELRADRVAGCILARAELPVGPFLAYLEDEDKGPPALDDRTAAILAGVRTCERGAVIAY